MLAVKLEPLAARHRHVEVRALRKQSSELRSRRDHVLEVVEQKEQSAVAHGLFQRAACP